MCRRSASTNCRSCVARQLRGLRAGGPLPRARVRAARAVLPAMVRVTRQLAGDGRGCPSEPPGDRAHRLAACCAQSDLLALGEGQAAAFEVTSATGTNPAASRDPSPTLLAVGSGRRGGVGDGLTTLQSAPEGIHHLGHHPLAEHNDHSHAPGSSRLARSSRQAGASMHPTGCIHRCVVVHSPTPLPAPNTRPSSRGVHPAPLTPRAGRAPRRPRAGASTSARAWKVLTAC